MSNRSSATRGIFRNSSYKRLNRRRLIRCFRHRLGYITYNTQWRPITISNAIVIFPNSPIDRYIFLDFVNYGIIEACFGVKSVPFFFSHYKFQTYSLLLKSSTKRFYYRNNNESYNFQSTGASPSSSPSNASHCIHIIYVLYKNYKTH